MGTRSLIPVRLVGVGGVEGFEIIGCHRLCGFGDVTCVGIDGTGVEAGDELVEGQAVGCVGVVDVEELDGWGLGFHRMNGVKG